MLETFIRQFAEMGAVYYQFLLTHGRAWTAQPLPANIPRGRSRACYENAGTLALQDSRLTYVEGVAFNLIPTGHAWVVGPDGLVIDPTWEEPENREYFGLALRTEYLIEVVHRNGVWGVMGEMIPKDLVADPAKALHPDWHAVAAAPQSWD